MANKSTNITFDSSKFGWIEYTAFCSLLSVSALIGIYYGCIKKQNTVTEYMLGGKSMSIFPIGMSLVASHVSGITLLGIPSEVYEHGTQYAAQIAGTLFVVYFTNKFCLPIFFSLQLYSVYEYLELRFSRVVRKICSFIFATALILYIPMVIYVPALAFQQVSGADIHMVAPIICALCIFYTTIGGLKAVVWTDTIQGLFTIGVTMVVSVIGVINNGGVKMVYEANVRGDRWEFFNFDPNPLNRITFWTTSLGAFFMWVVSMTVHPGSAQRFVALPSKRAAQWAVMWFGLGYTCLVLLSSLVGNIIYARYENCDPIKSLKIEKSGQLLPYYVQEVASSYPGLTGLFISGLISAALSTMSAGLNTVAGTIYEDFIEAFMPKNTTEGVASLIMKIIVVLVGFVCILLIYIVEQLGEILSVSFALSSAQNGAIFSAFILGMFFPWANTTGAICGIAVSFLANAWLIVTAQIAKMEGALVYPPRVTSIQNCDTNINMINNDTVLHNLYTNYTQVADGTYVNDINPLYALSFLYYTPFGAFIGIFVGLVVSYLTGGTNLKELNPNLFSPPIRRFLPKYEDKNLEDYKTVEIPLKNADTKLPMETDDENNLKS